MNLSDIVVCNGPMIARIRKTVGFTQETLAEAADLSVRVIRKAESGGEVRFSTLKLIAEAIQRCGASVSAGDLCTDAVEVARTFVEASRIHKQNMVSHVRHLLSEDLVTFVAGDPWIIPFSGMFHGPEGLTKFWNQYFALIDHCDDELTLNYFINGLEVIASGTENRRLNGHRSAAPDWLCLKFKISGGIIVGFEYYFDTQSAQKQLKQHQNEVWRDD